MRGLLLAWALIGASSTVLALGGTKGSEATPSPAVPQSSLAKYLGYAKQNCGPLQPCGLSYLFFKKRYPVLHDH